MKKFSALIFSTISVAGCGGGNDSLSESDGIVSLHGNVTVCAAASNSRAKVSLPYGQDQGYDVTTNADGSFAMEVDTANFKGVNPVALAIQSENCEPENIYIENIASAGRNGRIDTPATTMRDLGPAVFLIPPPWRPLTHLGDDKYGGTANSQLQVATSGLTTVQPLGVLTQQLKDQYKFADVEFSARGMQTESQQCATQYDNQIGLSATGASSSAAVVKTVQPGASSADGNFSQFSIPIDLSDFPVGSTINFVANTGQCASGGTDHDDFELTEVIVRLRKE